MTVVARIDGAGGAKAMAEARRADPRARPGSPTKVVYILAWGRSGSTILDNALGEVDGFFSAGEIRFLWVRGVTKGWRCGCGKPVVECEVWSTVLAELSSEGDLRDEAVTVESWQNKLARVRHTWSLLKPGRAARRSHTLQPYVDKLGRLFRTTSDVTGAHVIVDSSKRPSDAAMLGLVDSVDLYAVHLVRDPRAVAHSWSKRNSRVGRHGVVKSTWSWVVWNLAAEAVRRRLGERALFVRYEDFVRAPKEVLERIIAMVGEEPSALPPLAGNRLELGPNHTVSGNPSRFRTGAVEIRPDSRWLSELSGLKWWVATALALPLLGRYGYGRGRSRPDRRAQRGRS